jgi:hypothetical protein
VPDYLQNSAGAAEFVWVYAGQSQYANEWDESDIVAACEAEAMAAWHEWQLQGGANA